MMGEGTVNDEELVRERRLLTVVLIFMLALLVVASTERGQWSMLLSHLLFGATCSWYGFKRGQTLADSGGSG